MEPTQHRLSVVVGAGSYNDAVEKNVDNGEDQEEEEDAEAEPESDVSKRTASPPSNFIPTAGKNEAIMGRKQPAALPPPSGEEAAIHQDREKLRARVFELENRLRETEEELEFYFTFYKRAKRVGGAAVATTATGDTTAVKNNSGGDRQPAGGSGRTATAAAAPAAVSFDDSESDSDLDDGAAPGNAYYSGERATAQSFTSTSIK